MDQDPLQYVKDITALSWKDLGYSNRMTRELGGQNNNKFLGGSDFAAYIEDGGIEELLRKLNPNALFDLSLENSKIKPFFRGATAVVAPSGNGDFSSIQPALNYVHNVGGGKVLVLPGTYDILSELTIYTDTIFEGISVNDCVLDFKNTTNNLSTESAGSNIDISNLTFQNCQDTTNGTIYLNQASRVRITNCIFDNNKDVSSNGYDINCVGSSDVSIDFCQSTNSATFLYGQAMGQNSRVQNCNITCANRAIWGKVGNPNPAITGLFINTCNIVSDKACIYGRFNQLSVISCELANNEEAVSLTEATIDINGNGGNNIFIGNVISPSDGGRQAITITGTGIDVFNNHFYGNNMGGGTGYDGVKITSADYTTFYGNSISSDGAGTYAINISDAASNNTIIIGNILTGIAADTQDLGTGSVIANNA